jgi:hypothetical protein
MQFDILGMNELFPMQLQIDTELTLVPLPLIFKFCNGRLCKYLSFKYQFLKRPHIIKTGCNRRSPEDDRMSRNALPILLQLVHTISSMFFIAF